MITCMHDEMLCNSTVTLNNNLRICCAEMAIRANTYIVVYILLLFNYIRGGGVIITVLLTYPNILLLQQK